MMKMVYRADAMSHLQRVCLASAADSQRLASLTVEAQSA
jgi:hypothetical protein